MPYVHVCPLSQVTRTVAAARASHLVTLLNVGTLLERPPAIAAANHLFLGMNDIIEATDGMVLPGAEHVGDLLAFVNGWDRSQPLVIHYFAGISRSTAAAFITLCALAPERDEAQIAGRLRAASSHATPNPRLVAIGDDILGRGGRMVDAAAAIGRGDAAMEGVPFRLAIEE